MAILVILGINWFVNYLVWQGTEEDQNGEGNVGYDIGIDFEASMFFFPDLQVQILCNPRYLFEFIVAL